MNTPQLEQWLTAQQDNRLRMQVSSLAARLAIEHDLDVPTARYEALLHHYLKYTPRAHPVGPAPPASAFRRGGKQVSFMGQGGSKVEPISIPAPEPEPKRTLTHLNPNDTKTYGPVSSPTDWEKLQKTMYYQFVKFPDEKQKIWYKEQIRMGPITKEFGNMGLENIWLRDQGTHNLLMSKLSPTFKKAFPNLKWQEAMLQLRIKPPSRAASPKEEEVRIPGHIPSAPSHASSRAASRSASPKEEVMHPPPPTTPRPLGEKVLFLPKTAPLPKGSPRTFGGQYPHTAAHLSNTLRGASTSTGYKIKKRGGEIEMFSHGGMRKLKKFVC
jgi:hypothetical protein